MDTVDATLITALRQLCPHRVRVYDSAGDEPRLIAVPHGRKRWSKVATTIAGMPWVKCELLAKDESILGYVENAEAAELEDISGSPPRQNERFLLEMMIKAQTTALTFRDKEHSALLEAMRDLLAVHAQSTRELIELFKIQRDVAAETAALSAAADGDVLTQIVKLMDSSPGLQAALGPIIGKLLAGGAQRQIKAAKPAPPPAPPNGAKS